MPQFSASQAPIFISTDVPNYARRGSPQNPTVPSGSDGLLQRVITGLEIRLQGNAPVDIIEFVTSPLYLGKRLYPRQELILRVYYKLPLLPVGCWCGGHKPFCNFCGGSGHYDMLGDARRLLSSQNKYARLVFPHAIEDETTKRIKYHGLCSHHAYGEDCGNKECHEDRADFRQLTNAELQERLLSHHAHILEVIAGRRGSKSALGSFVNAYELYKMLRDPHPQHTWGLFPTQEIGTANVATDEEQAKVLFNQMAGHLFESPWFRKLYYRQLEATIQFGGRNIVAKSLHSNSSSVRGRTLIAIFMDEYCHFNRTAGRLSDDAMWAALAPSTITFGEASRIVITSSPLNKAGKAWELFDQTEQGKINNCICFQLATWEMNPTVDRDDPQLVGEFVMDPDYAEVEYGAQWAETVSRVIPGEAVDACVDRTMERQQAGSRGVRYCLHIDNAKKRDSVGLAITHYDRERGLVIFDVIEEHSPTDPFGELTGDHAEINQQKLVDRVLTFRSKGFTFDSITCDQFNSAWLVQELRKSFGDERVEEIFVTDKRNREVFLNLRSLFVQHGCRIYYHSDAIRQCKELAQITKQSGSVKYAAPPGQKDDIVNAMACAAYRTLELALGVGSGIYVTNLNSHLQVSAPAEPFRKGLQHHPDCTAAYCHYMCPVQLALAAS